ncbi:hypothetical protein [Arsenicibacter rosenii]|uniref:Uncharacterized protein n=1 Tax=Arsenicibacter rosenii TaxID=1750698 RepID=A0A1S2VNN5_9BACT|nr:hypothetical protein [Arsenicibacter rosenii]OIN60387.1 hypothetical protein BLX24_06065 [Arsenicibacter rosenii]
MKEMVKKLGQLAGRLAAQKGDFTLFALVLPEDTIAWDLLVAAPWIDYASVETLRFLVSEVQSTLSKDELANLAAIKMMDNSLMPKDSFMSMSSDMGWLETDIDFYGVPVKKAYIFVAPVADFQIARAA